MLFNSFVFLGFLIAVVPTYYLIKGLKGRNIFLLFCSYFFYGYWDWRFLGLLFLSTVVDYLIGLNISKTDNQARKRLLLILSLITNLGILFFFKYFNFFIDSFNALTTSLGFKLDFLHVNVILPVGISFYTFQTLSYTIDIYKEKLQPTKSFLNFALFVSFFPQLVAGPIERAKNLLPQIEVKHSFDKTKFHDGITLITFGLFRKVVIGDTAGRFVDHIFYDLNLYTSPELIFGLLLFAIQIYADFSGYSSIARGTAKILGIELMKNFNQPYFSKNVSEFWKRWHISLSSWLRDYIYISLGGNRKSEIRTYLNLMITMLLGGLWHGASWNFVIWGGLHGMYLIVHKLYTKYCHFNIANFISMLFTNFLVLFTWLFFRANSVNDVHIFLSHIFNWLPSSFVLVYIKLFLGFSIFIFGIDYLQVKTHSHVFINRIRLAPIRNGIIASIWFVVLVFMLTSNPLPFVYFQF